MRTATLFIAVLSIVYSTNTNAQSISNLPARSIVSLERSEESLFYKEVIPKRDIAIISHKRENEYFTPSDTNRRDYISIDGKIFVFDSLIGGFASDYTMNYSTLEVYLLEKKGVEYLILYGGDTFFSMNSDPPSYLLFSKQNKEWFFYKTYYLKADESSSKIRFRIKNNKVILKGKNLVTID